jgi:hypothetical protein
MFSNRIGPIGVSVLVLTASSTGALAQQNPFLNPQNPAYTQENGITFNPIPPPSTSSPLLPARPENPVSPALPTGLLPDTTGTNPLTGLPCTGPGSLAVSGAGTLPGSSAPPVNGSAIGSASGTATQIPGFSSVFQPGNNSGAC